MIHFLFIFINFIYCSQAATNGICGASETDCSWSFENEILSIEGTGKMTNFADMNSAPWNEHAEKIQSVSIGSITSIGDFAFSFLSQITQITIPSTIATIGINPFIGCSKLKTIDVQTSKYTFTWDILMTADKTLMITYPETKRAVTEVLSTSIKIIGKYAFYGHPTMERLTFQSVHTNIGDYALANCKKLKRLFHYATSPTIGKNVLLGCDNLEGIYVPVTYNGVFDGFTVRKATKSPYSNRFYYLDSTGYLIYYGIGEMDSYRTSGLTPFRNL